MIPQYNMFKQSPESTSVCLWKKKWKCAHSRHAFRWSTKRDAVRRTAAFQDTLITKDPTDMIFICYIFSGLA